MNWLMIAAARYGAADLSGPLVKTILPLIIFFGVIRIVIEILKPARRSERCRHGRTGKKREMSQDEARAILVVIVLLVFSAFEYWLWTYKGMGGRLGAIVIPLGIIALVTIVVLRLRKRKVQGRGGDGGIRVPLPPQGDEGATDEDVAVREGAKGEVMVREAMKSLPADRYVVLHDVWLPMEDGGETQIDHVIVSQFGIFIVETKNWKGTIYADAKSAVWTKYNLGHKATYKNPIRQNYKHIISIREKFSRSGAEFVFGVVAMSPAADFKGGVPEGVVFYNELKGWILGHVTPRIKPGQVADIVVAIQEWSATVSETARRRHCGKDISDVVRKLMDLGFSREDAEARLKTHWGKEVLGTTD